MAVGLTSSASPNEKRLIQTAAVAAADLGSNASGKGASLVGVQDAAGDYAGATVEAVLAELPSLFQPLDADLTTWAGLTPSANAQSLVTAANYAAMRAQLDLEAGVDVQAYAANLDDWSGEAVADYSNTAAIAAAYQPLDSDLTNLAALTTDPRTETISFVIENSGAAIGTGVAGFIEAPFACTITQATALADQSGSIVVDVWKDTYANYPPTDADSITASAPVTISTATKSQDATLTGWTTSVSAGDILGFNVDSASTVTRVTVSLTVVRA